MLEKLDFIIDKYSELSDKASDASVIANQPEWQRIVKEMGELEPIVHKYSEYKKLRTEVDDIKEMLESGGLFTDEKEMFREEALGLESQLPTLEEELKLLLLPQDPNDDKNIFLEIRAGTGGDEAALFGADLLRMYMRYAERHGYKVEIIANEESGIGGIKEAVVLIKGKGAYSRLKYESGVHRVQRVPETESGGRVHTSAATVAVLPEVDDVEVHIDPNDVRTDVFRSSGNGGQSVNTTDSAVRLTHLPTGIVVSCQDEKSQIKNKDKAMKVLRSRVYDLQMAAQKQEISDARKTMVGTGDRSERIRTYNFPQGRISDHRIGLTIYKLDSFMDGDLDEVIDALITNDQAEKMRVQ